MKASQKVKFSMYKSVAGFFAEHESIVNSMPALKETVALLNSTILLISQATAQKVQVITGPSVVKRKARRALARQACTIAANLYAHAERTGDDGLKSKVNYTKSDLQRLPDGELPAVCRNILALAWENLAALAAFNVVAADLELFGGNITDYETLEQTPRIEASKKMTHNSTMTLHIKGADKLMKKQLDKIMDVFKETNLAFYSTYINTRTILDAATRRTQIKGVVVNAADNSPLHGVTIEIVETKQSTITPLDGSFLFKPIKPKTYHIIVSKPGFISQTLEVVIEKRGSKTKLKFAMQRES